MTIIDDVKQLYNQKLYSNVTCLANHLLTIGNHNAEFLPPPTKLKLLVWYADSLFEQREFRKAEATYQKALQLKKALLKSKGKSQTFMTGDVTSEVDIKYNMHLCYVNFKQVPHAIAMLETIPGKQRTVRVNMALAKLYHQSGMERSAITSYKEVLKECPSALDAALGLLSLGVKGAEVAAMTLSGSSTTPNMEWLSIWIKGHAALYSREFSQAIMTFNALETRTVLQGNAEILVWLAEAHYFSGDYKQSLSVLHRAHSIDPYLTRGMDIYSSLLAREKQYKELEKLSTWMSTELEHAAESWVALGNYVVIHKTATKGSYYAYKAIQLNPRNVEAYLLKGRILLDAKKYQDAVSAYREALAITPFSFEAHQGLVKTYIGLHRTREAITLAKNACLLLSQTPRTLSLYASALAAEPASVDKAEACLEKALKQDPTNLDIIYQLAEFYQQERRYEKGIELLKKQTALQSTSRLHRLLADFFTHMNDNDKAMEHFSAAINLDTRNHLAVEGLQRVEQHLDSARGANYNAPGVDIHDSENDAELDESEVEGVWSDDEAFPL